MEPQAFPFVICFGNEQKMIVAQEYILGLHTPAQALTCRPEPIRARTAKPRENILLFKPERLLHS